MKINLNNKGFTLIEIIIVLVILGILAAAFIPTALGQIERANETIDIENLQLAIKCANYYVLNKHFKQGTTYYWDVVTADFVTEMPDKKYGRGKETDGGAIHYAYDNSEVTIGKVISLTFDGTTNYEINWVS